MTLVVENTFKKSFGNQEIEFFMIEHECWFSPQEIAKGLGVSRQAVNNLYNRRKDEFEDFTAVIDLMTPQGSQQKTRIFNERGLYLFTLLSRGEKAADFRKWVTGVVEQIRKTGKFEIQQKSDFALVEVIEKQDRHEQDIMEIKEKIQLMEENQPITDGTMKEIRDLIDTIHTVLGVWIWKELYGPCKFSKISRVTEKKGREILQYIKRNYLDLEE